MIYKNIQILIIVLLTAAIPFQLNAEAYKTTLAQMPVYAESATKGVLVDFVKAMEKISDNTMSISVYPFSRSMNNVLKGNADFHIPLIKNDIIPEEKLPYSYSTETIFHVNFVLYTRKGSNVTPENLHLFNVETDRAHVDYFPFKSNPAGQIDLSLKKLHRGRIDAFVFSDAATDVVLKELGFNDIKRTLYKRFDVKIILPKNDHGKKIDQMLTSTIQKLRASGEFDKIMGPIDLPYDNWQP